MLDRVLTILNHLVACDTQNPPRAITPDNPAISYCAGVLKSSGCRVNITDLGDGCVMMLATRGQARTIMNCHLDTVPADPSWTRDPFQLAVDSARAVGLGACDVKGALSCMLVAIEQSDGAVALLVTTDEEAGQSRCVRHFLTQDHPYDRAIVAEPTGARAVTKHRGLATYEIAFQGVAAHSSLPGADQHNAVHLAALWCAHALELTKSPPFNDIRLNIGMIEGGTKPNVAASSARVVFGMRPPSGMHPNTPTEALAGLVSNPLSCEWKTRFSAPGLDVVAGTEVMIENYHFAEGAPVDFWTEAALFSEAGRATVVLGPGNIKQAHAAGEFVLLEDLRCAAECYRRVFSDQHDIANILAINVCTKRTPCDDA